LHDFPQNLTIITFQPVSTRGGNYATAIKTLWRLFLAADFHRELFAQE